MGRLVPVKGAAHEFEKPFPRSDGRQRKATTDDFAGLGFVGSGFADLRSDLGSDSDLLDSDPDFDGIAQTVFEAFVTGRYAITQNDYLKLGQNFRS